MSLATDPLPFYKISSNIRQQFCTVPGHIPASSTSLPRKFSPKRDLSSQASCVSLGYILPCAGSFCLGRYLSLRSGCASNDWTNVDRTFRQCWCTRLDLYFGNSIEPLPACQSSRHPKGVCCPLLGAYHVATCVEAIVGLRRVLPARKATQHIVFQRFVAREGC